MAPMKFCFTETMCDPSHLLPLAMEADQAGYDTFYVPDSICYPAQASDKYPYTPTGDREFLEQAPFIDPFSLVSAMGAVTRNLRFATFVIKLPIREPVLVAKQTASVAVLTDNRFSLGVGLSPWIEDFEVCNQEWKTRGRRMDQMIEIIRGLCTTAYPDYFEYHGADYELPKIRINPIPTEPVPIHIGGTSEPALRRAARIGDGWMYAGFDREHLEQCIGSLQKYRREYSREKEPFEIHAPPIGAKDLDDFKRFADLGITHCGLGARSGYEKDTLTLQQKIDILKSIAENVVQKLQ
jgi:probable F420-dependent oxidoreductase